MVPQAITVLKAQDRYTGHPEEHGKVNLELSAVIRYKKGGSIRLEHPPLSQSRKHLPSLPKDA